MVQNLAGFHCTNFSLEENLSNKIFIPFEALFKTYLTASFDLVCLYVQSFWFSWVSIFSNTYKLTKK